MNIKQQALLKTAKQLAIIVLWLLAVCFTIVVLPLHMLGTIASMVALASILYFVYRTNLDSLEYEKKLEELQQRRDRAKSDQSTEQQVL